MNTIRLPVRASGNMLVDANENTVVIFMNGPYESDWRQCAELARVINSHDALVEALNELYNVVAGPIPANCRVDFDAAIKKAEAALKLAEGGK